MIDQAKALERGKWWMQFINGDVEAAASHLAPDLLRVGPRPRDANHEMRGKPEYIQYLRGVVETMPRLNESTVHDIAVSQDGRRVYIHVTEIDSLEPGSREKTIAVSAVMINHLNDDGLISLIDVFWKQPEMDYEWTGTEKK